VAKTVYFKGLTELRGIAAIGVMFNHIELYKSRQGELSLFGVRYLHSFIEQLGKNGVYLFFVLSGFLITYLLLEERAKSGTIAVRKFYVRRILRIWPLYYIIIGISFFIIPLTLNHPFWITEFYYQHEIENLTYGVNLTLCLFFLSNLALIIFNPVAGAAQSWSVSVEEQFYIFWPLLVKFFHKHILRFLLIIAILKPLASVALGIILRSPSPGVRIALSFFDGMKFEYMALGGILAYFILNKKHLADKIFYSGKLFLLLLVLLVLSLLVNRYAYLNALLFAFLIGFITSSNFENKFLKKIGTVSYGVYMYHPIMMYIGFAIAHNFFKNYNALFTLPVEYLLVFGLTYLISSLSYKYIESYFLKFKSKFSIIHSKTN